MILIKKFCIITIEIGKTNEKIFNLSAAYTWDRQRLTGHLFSGYEKQVGRHVDTLDIDTHLKVPGHWIRVAIRSCTWVPATIAAKENREYL